MPQIKHTFVESKMNKDLDDRLLSGGQYRNAVNIAVSKSDDSNVGALENVLGNYKISDFFPNGYSVPPGLDIIGCYFNTVSDDVIVFLTNFVDPLDPLAIPYSKTNAYENSKHFINIYNLKNQTANILVEGLFLNFSVNNRINGIDIAEDFLFWTDNRNQPRKINWKTALNNSSYYTNEDSISIVKFAPYKAIEVHEEVTITDVITTSVATSLDVETYNSDTNTYSTQNVMDYYVTPATQSPYSKIVFSNDSIEDIPLYTYFRLQDSNGGDSALLQVFAKDPNNTTLYTWPRVSNTSATWDKAIFYNSNMRDTTSSHLPPSARFELDYTLNNVKNVSGPTDDDDGEAIYNDTIPGSTILYYLNGGSDIDSGSGVIGDNDSITTDNRASKYGLPFGLFGGLINTTDMLYTQKSYFENTTGLKVGDEWIPTRITSNTLRGRDTGFCFLINSSNNVSASDRMKASYGLPYLDNYSTASTPWNLALNEDIKFSFGKHYFDLSDTKSWF